MSFNYHCNAHLQKVDLEGGGWTIKERTCEFCSKGSLILDEKSEDFLCPNSEETKLKLMGENTSGRSTPQMTKEEIKNDRLKRSREHFRKEIFHTLDKDGQRSHFRKDSTLTPSVDISLPTVSKAAKKEISKKSR